ncbi:MAG: hypothetical protein WBO89_00020 [Propionicimonas sp.]
MQLNDADRAELDAVAGQPVKAIVRGLVDAVDPDVQALTLPELVEGSPEEWRGASTRFATFWTPPCVLSPNLRSRILELRRAHDRVIDEVNADRLIDAYGVVDAARPHRRRVVAHLSGGAPLRAHRTAGARRGNTRRTSTEHPVKLYDLDEDFFGEL